MNALERNYEVTRKDLAKGKVFSLGVWLSPFLFSLIPALILFVLYLLSGAIPLFFFSLFALGIGFFLGLIISGILIFYRQKWLAQIRERIAVDGIKAEEVGWFPHELTTQEKKSLKEMSGRDPLLADAYRETLASRLTAARITKTTKNELLLVRKRQNKLKYLKTEVTADLQDDLRKDAENLSAIKTEAEQMLIEAKTRLQMIEAATRRGTNFADTELALKKLSARSAELPLALEALKMEKEIRLELEKEDREVIDNE